MHRRFSAVFVGLAVLSSLVDTALAEVSLPCVFSEHMVLQRDKPVAVWGWADKGEVVTVSIAGQEAKGTADEEGHWSLRIGPLSAGGPHELVVKGNNTISVRDVLVGEVWLCSGQSNMAMSVRGAAEAEAEIASADHPGLRMITVTRQASPTPAEKCEGQWQVSSPETAGGFSATAYFFGRQLHKDLEVPVGLITSAWGGTAVEAWTSLDAQQAQDQLQPILAPWVEEFSSYDPEAEQARYEKAMAAWQQAAKEAKADGGKVPRRPTAPVDPRLNQNRPANLYNGMIHPLLPFGIRGAIWYQGERNSRGETSALYGLQLKTLIADWRARFSQGDFPFYFVQLPNYLQPQQEPSEHTGWVMVREGMLKTLELQNTGMAITIDVGDAGNIHPKNKQAVGYRLALAALAGAYGKSVVASGPIFKEMAVEQDKVVIRFDYVCDGLKTTDGGPVKGFAIAGTNRQFVWAEAKIEGDNIVVSSPEVPRPLAVRYAWANNPEVNLVNSAGLPASPFRTDNWIEPIAGR